MAADAQVLLARTQTQTLQPSLPPLVTIVIGLKMGGSRVGGGGGGGGGDDTIEGPREPAVKPGRVTQA